MQHVSDDRLPLEVCQVMLEYAGDDDYHPLAQCAVVVDSRQVDRQRYLAGPQSSVRQRLVHRHTTPRSIRVGPLQHLVARLTAVISRLDQLLRVVPGDTVPVSRRCNCTQQTLKCNQSLGVSRSVQQNHHTNMNKQLNYS